MEKRIEIKYCEERNVYEKKKKSVWDGIRIRGYPKDF